jgi:hypothetical protein
MLMHCLVPNTLSSLLNLTFKFSSHKILLYNNTFTFNDCVTLIWLMSHSVNVTLVLILINSIISGFSRTLIIVFTLTLCHNVDINSLIRYLLLPWNVLALVSSIGAFVSSCFMWVVIAATTDGGDAGAVDCVLISFLILDESTKVLHLLSVYVGA